MLIGIVASLGVLALTMPHVRPLRFAFYLVLGLPFLAAGLFIDSWFADVFAAHQIRRYGPQEARLILIVLGLGFIGVGVAYLFF